MRQTAFLAVFFSAVTVLPAADPGLVNMIMPDTKVAAGVNVARAKTSPFGVFLIANLPQSDPGFQQFVTMSGFDPRTDLQEVLMASNGQQKNGIVLARGAFNIAKIIAAATSDGKHQSTMYNGAQLIVNPTETQSEAVAFLTDVTPAIAVIGDLANVKGAIDRHKTTNPVDPSLAAKLAAYSTSDAWSVSLAPVAALPVPAGALGQADLLKTVQQASGGIMLTSPVQISGEAVASSSQDATALGDVIKFLATMVQTQGGKTNPEVATLFQSLSVSTDGSTLKITLSIPETDLENLLKSAEATHGKKAARI